MSEIKSSAYLRLLSEIVQELVGQHVALVESMGTFSRTEAGQITAAQWIAAALTVASTLGIRQLRGAEHLILGGWAAEARTLIRSAWEIAIDVGYILEGDRQHRARLYGAMVALRYKKVIEPQTEEQEKKAQEILLDKFRPIAQEFSNHPGVEAGHWSGENNKGSIRKKGVKYIAEILGEDEENLLGSTRRIAFQFSSATVHGDPASYVWMPNVDDPGKIDPDFAHLPTEIPATLAVFVGLMLLAPLESEVRSNSHRGEAPNARRLSERFARLLKSSG